MFESHLYRGIMQVISEHFSEEGYEIYLVGGIVRDELLDVECSDIDFATDACPTNSRRILEGIANTTVYDLGGERFGCVAASIDGVKVEITTYRDEVYDEDRNPEVTFGLELEADLARRDFTMNALAYNYLTGELIDYFGGQEDLEAGCIRAIGNPRDRFTDDPLRMLRAVRFCGQIGGYLERDTYLAIRRMSGHIRSISMERIRDELTKCLMSDDPTLGLSLMCDLNLIDHFLPELLPLAGCDQPKMYHRYDALRHTFEVVKNTPRSLPLRLAALLHDIGKPRCKTYDEDRVPHFYEHHKKSADMTRTIMDRLRFSTHQKEMVAHLVYNHMKPHALEDEYRLVRRFVNRTDLVIGETLVIPSEIIVSLAIADVKGTGRCEPEDVERYESIIDTIALVREKSEDVISCPVTGEQVMSALGIGPCRLVGKVKNLLTERMMDGAFPLGDTDAALVYLEEQVKPGIVVRESDFDLMV